MTTYRIAWVIDIDEDTPDAAVLQAVDIMQDPDSIATTFHVTDLGTGEAITKDFNDIIHPETKEYVPADDWRWNTFSVIASRSHDFGPGAPYTPMMVRDYLCQDDISKKYFISIQPNVSRTWLKPEEVDRFFSLFGVEKE
jgi:hypothetical protein